MVIKKGYHLEPIIFGGGHQKEISSRTLNVPGIVGEREACCLRRMEREEDEKAIAVNERSFSRLLLEKMALLNDGIISSD